jgi:hypothetical protein
MWCCVLSPVFIVWRGEKEGWRVMGRWWWEKFEIDESALEIVETAPQNPRFGNRRKDQIARNAARERASV